jgi:CubicO group peptidase (beta-lactamase class C family)
MQRLLRFRVLVIILFLFIVQSVAFAQSATLKDLDSFVEKTRQTFEVPGIAIAVVKDGQVVFTKGYGVRRLGEPALVDPHTLFGIASNTKAFTAAALAILVDDGKINWDDRVSQHLPGFEMYDAYASHEMTIRDLLTHRSGLGLGAGDLMYFPPTTFTREEIVRRLRFIKPAASFRSRYVYDNILLVVAGQVVSAVSGKSWDEFIKGRILVPLGMSESNTSVSVFRPEDNVATPHARVNGRVEPVEFGSCDNWGPAAGINSNVTDMAKWMIVQLNHGLISGAKQAERRLFSEQASREMWSSQMVIPVGTQPPPLSTLQPNFSAYGLGWGLADYRGKKIVSHTGGLPGFVTRVTLVPEQNLGVVVLTNQEEGGAFSAITYHILDEYFGVPATDWNEAFFKAKQLRKEKATEAANKLNAARVKDTKPSLPLEKYADKYNDPWYGGATMSLESGHLVLRLDHSSRLIGDLEHWQYDTFVARWRDRSLNADAFVTFSLKPDGTIEQMKMAAVSPQTDFSFDFQDLLFTPASKPAAVVPKKP